MIARMYRNSLKRAWLVGAFGLLAFVLCSTLTFASLKLTNVMRYSNLWQAIAADYQLQSADDQAFVNREIKWFTQIARNRVYIHSLSINARPYLYYVFEQIQKRDMPAELALLPMIESNYRPYKYSITGATGLWQMMPGTASGLGIKINWWYDGRRNIEQSTQAALNHLQDLHAIFHNWLLAIAAYNCGAGTVLQAMHYNREHHRPTDFWALPLPKQTKTYVPKLLALAKIFADPSKYHVNVISVPNDPYFTTIKMHQRLAISEISKLADATISTVRELNPAFRRWSTGPNTHYILTLPIANSDIFKVKLAQLHHTLHHRIYYHVKLGQNLSTLAQLFHTRVSVLKRLNHLNSDVIHVHQRLLVPNKQANQYFALIERNNGSISEDRLPGPKRHVHVVHLHETLVAIAQKYKVTPDQIRYWNELSYHAMIKPEQRLVIWQ